MLYAIGCIILQQNAMKMDHLEISFLSKLMAKKTNRVGMMTHYHTHTALGGNVLASCTGDMNPSVITELTVQQ